MSGGGRPNSMEMHPKTSNMLSNILLQQPPSGLSCFRLRRWRRLRRWGLEEGGGRTMWFRFRRWRKWRRGGGGGGGEGGGGAPQINLEFSSLTCILFVSNIDLTPDVGATPTSGFHIDLLHCIVHLQQVYNVPAMFIPIPLVEDKHLHLILSRPIAL